MKKIALIFRVLIETYWNVKVADVAFSAALFAAY